MHDTEHADTDRRFEDFYLFDYPRLVGALRLVTGDDDAARDAVDEACARAWARLQRGHEIEVLAAWIRVVACNSARGRVTVFTPRLNTASGWHTSATACSGVAASTTTISAGLPTAMP